METQIIQICQRFQLTYTQTISYLHLLRFWKQKVCKYQQKTNNVNSQLKLLQNITNLQNIKVGIIGGGVIGRLFLNSLIVFQKQGLNPENIYLSTRQVEDFENYKTSFKINIEFNNQKITQICDIIIITVPATLDNWVIADIKESIYNRLNSVTKTSSKTNGGPQVEIQKSLLHPLVYITTSNMTKQKIAKLFNFPVMTPFVRGDDHQYLNLVLKNCKYDKNTGQDSYLEQLQQFITQRICNDTKFIKQTLMFVFQRSLYNPEKQRKFTSMGSSQKNSKSGKTITIQAKQIGQNLVTVSNKSQSVPLKEKVDKIKEKEKVQSYQSSMNVSSYSSNNGVNLNAYNIETIKNIIEDSLVKNQTIQQTFLVRCRKWRMTYHNFIS